MESERFDEVARLLAIGSSRRGAITTLAALTGAGLAGLDTAEAKKRRKKKKKKKPPVCTTCTALGDFCGSESFCRCCGELECVGDVCCKTNGSDCGFSAECCGTMTCRPIGGGGTCQPCVTAGGSCNDVSECCANIQSCTNNQCVA